MAKGERESSKQLTEQRRTIFEGDRSLWIIFAVLIVLSILVVYSSTAKMVFDISSKMTTTDALRNQIMFVGAVLSPLFFLGGGAMPLGLQYVSSLARDRTYAHCSGSTES